MRLAAAWAEGYERVLNARESAAAIASTHESPCGCLACRVVADDQIALRAMLERSDGSPA